MISQDIRRTPKRWRLLPCQRERMHFFFAFPMRGGENMYLTLEELFLIAGFILALLTYIELINKKKYPPALRNLGGYYLIITKEATVIGALRYYYNTKARFCQQFYFLFFYS